MKHKDPTLKFEPMCLLIAGFAFLWAIVGSPMCFALIAVAAGLDIWSDTLE